MWIVDTGWHSPHIVATLFFAVDYVHCALCIVITGLELSGWGGVGGLNPPPPVPAPQPPFFGENRP